MKIYFWFRGEVKVSNVSSIATTTNDSFETIKHIAILYQCSLEITSHILFVIYGIEKTSDFTSLLSLTKEKINFKINKSINERK